MNARTALMAGFNARTKALLGTRYRSRVRKSWDMSELEFWRSQADALRSIYRSALGNVPFYRDAKGMYPRSLPAGDHPFSLLNELPILEKQQLRDQNDRFFRQPKARTTTVHTTSGTSGTPLRLAATSWERAFWYVIREEWIRRVSGIRRPRTVHLAGHITPEENSDQVVWVNRYTRDAHLSIYSLSPENRSKVVEFFHAFRPQVIYGYASAAHQLASLVGPVGREMRDECVVITTSEVMLPTWREDLEQTICRNVFDMYSSQEGSHAVFQCEASRMHISPLVGIVEIVDEHGQPCSLGQSGRVLVSGLLRRSMPLFRYAVGDTVTSTGYAADCSCGLEWPTIGTVNGRTEDLVRTRDGRQVGMLWYHSIKDLPGIVEAQLIQRDFERFDINLIRTPSVEFDQERVERSIRSQLESRLRAKLFLEFRYLEEIPRGAQGKFKAVIVRMEN